MLDAVAAGLGEIPAIVALLYADVDEKLHKPAGRRVLAHLVKLVDEGHRPRPTAAAPPQRPRVTGFGAGRHAAASPVPAGDAASSVVARSDAMSSRSSASISGVVSGLTRQTR